MANLYDKIIFRDGITLDDGLDTLTENFLANVGYICDLGRAFGLTLDRFEINDEMVHFDWRGRRGAVLEFYDYYSKNMTSESEETRCATLGVIRNKKSIDEEAE